MYYDVPCYYTHAEDIHHSHLLLLNLRTQFAYVLPSPSSDPRAMFDWPQASNLLNPDLELVSQIYSIVTLKRRRMTTCRTQNSVLTVLNRM